MQTLGLFERSESFGMANYGALKCTFSTQAKLGHVREPYVWPDGRGRFGRYGGRYVPETVIPALQHREATLTSLSTRPSFWSELRMLQRDYAGRETLLYFTARLSDNHKSSTGGGGPLIYLKREDLNHTSSHSMHVREPYVWPDGRGRFGRYGGRYVPETVIPALQHLEATLTSLSTQPSFWSELRRLQRDYAGRETPLYFAARLSDHHKSSAGGGGPLIYLKREDLNHTSSHSMNNALGQSLLAAHLGKRRIVAETGSGQEGISAAAAAARLGLECVIYMGAIDIERHPRNAARIKRLGAQLIPVHSGCSSLKDAMSEAMRDFVTNIHTTYHMFGSVVGPHPFPLLVRNFQAIIGQETRQQALEKWGSKPHVLLSCVGRGSGALGLFHEFIEDEDVRLIGVEAGGVGMKNGLHASTLTSGDLGVFHGAMTYLLQDSYGQTQKTHSISSDLNYPSVGPELSHLKDIGRVEVYSATDEEASKACKRLAKLEGIIPSLATSHALAYLEKLCPTLRHNDTIVVNCSGGEDE